MAKNVVGVFDTPAEAQAALEDLRGAGFQVEDISFMGSNASGEYGTFNERARLFDTNGDGLDAGEGATFGAISGGILGLLAGVGALAIPGIGPVIAGGVLASALAGTAIGAASGGLIGALVGAGIPEREAEVYAESVRRGGSMIMVHADGDEAVDRATAILYQHNVVNIDRRADEYLASGLTANANASLKEDPALRSAPATIEIPDPDLDVEPRALERGGVRVYSGSGSASDEGAIERNASKLGNAVERGLDADLDNDGDVGRRDPRNNI
jgi:hypothetical protein